MKLPTAKPAAITNYNKNMSGVDLQMSSEREIPHVGM